jgi:uncharacterized protein YjbI with pentapeptide repeats
MASVGFSWRGIIMSLQHRLPDQVVRADPWTFYVQYARSPEMTSAEMTRADVEAVIAAATSDQPADFTGKKLSGLDLSGLDLSGALLRAARLNRTKLNNAKLDQAILDQAWLLEADLSRASLRGWPLPGPHPARHAGLQRGLPGREIERASLCFQSPARICRNLACRLNAL